MRACMLQFVRQQGSIDKQINNIQMPCANRKWLLLRITNRSSPAEYRKIVSPRNSFLIRRMRLKRTKRHAMCIKGLVGQTHDLAFNENEFFFFFQENGKEFIWRKYVMAFDEFVSGAVYISGLLQLVHSSSRQKYKVTTQFTWMILSLRGQYISFHIW